MMGMWVDWIRGYRINRHYNLFFNIQFANYFQEEVPFSLRRPRLIGTSTELTLTTLHEVRLTKNFYMQAEAGLHGVVRKHPLLLTSVSFQSRRERWLWQFGFSVTSTFPSLVSPTNRFDSEQVLRNGSDHKISDEFESFVRYDFSIHPELVLQYFF